MTIIMQNLFKISPKFMLLNYINVGNFNLIKLKKKESYNLQQHRVFFTE